MNKPLAEVLRPESLNEYIGQSHLVGEGAILRSAIEKGDIPSMILWGPPGVGKTTLANIIANTLSAPFYQLSAINSGVKEVREVIEKAKQSDNAILFVDEIHRFSKNQQDSLLGAVEQGIVRLIGATTENPSFEVISPLLSRCQVYVLKSLEKEDLLKIIERATGYYKQTFGRNIIVKEAEALLRISGGDARKLMNAIELVVAQFKGDCIIDNEVVCSIIQQNLSMYDKKGENHYDIISAFIKSIRGSDPNAAVYWLARMIASGEDPLFIARRMLILASEDIGNANPNALLLANACFDAVNKIGYPECRIILSQTAVYLATSPKSNSTYLAINKALELVEQTGDLPVPLQIRNAPTSLMKQMGYGRDYLYSHDFAGHFVQQQFMPDALQTVELYSPCDNERENKTREHLRAMWQGVYKY
ncbi:MAG: replication-associated recombination protein A [Bacteroidales bacterium]|nr:replication-associated recombination protein A [Bacteroidales bacterium]MDY4584186.1 replication-associated recombination protein A [Candidatus Onthomorpha sp.]MCI6645410.1 replication-associated recombination protein A [Bacteroidales bacterium]MCI6800690.1 replication-associated recombination protein A [Bacteroidales bacterium]MCI6900347.1 replication-associated recombination protein A [Bacteroidales bacterium]